RIKKLGLLLHLEMLLSNLSHLPNCVSALCRADVARLARPLWEVTATGKAVIAEHELGRGLHVVLLDLRQLRQAIGDAPECRLTFARWQQCDGGHNTINILGAYSFIPQ